MYETHDAICALAKMHTGSVQTCKKISESVTCPSCAGLMHLRMTQEKLWRRRHSRSHRVRILSILRRPIVTLCPAAVMASIACQGGHLRNIGELIRTFCMCHFVSHD